VSSSSRATFATRSGAAGFTLIEVVVAVAILATALVAWLATYGSELRSLSRAREYAVAAELAEDRLAAVAFFAVDRLPNLPDSLEDGTFGDPFGEYRWVVEASSLSGTSLAEVSVTVSWPSGAHELTTVLPLPELRRVLP